MDASCGKKYVCCPTCKDKSKLFWDEGELYIEYGWINPCKHFSNMWEDFAEHKPEAYEDVLFLFGEDFILSGFINCFGEVNQYTISDDGKTFCYKKCSATPSQWVSMNSLLGH